MPNLLNPSYAVEETLNVLSHAAGIIISVIYLSLMMDAARHLDIPYVLTGVIIFGVTGILLYMASTIYHVWPVNRRLRSFFKQIDHSAIYVFIAGSFTAFAIMLIKDNLLIACLVTLWICALGGIAFKFTKLAYNNKWSLPFYIGMGLSGAGFLFPAFAGMPEEPFHLALYGGLCYLVGTIFYASERLPYNHFVWHLFVLGGTVLHYIAMLSLLEFESIG